MYNKKIAKVDERLVYDERVIQKMEKRGDFEEMILVFEGLIIMKS